jgi:electron transfer flavoprotein alpha subunit
VKILVFSENESVAKELLSGLRSFKGGDGITTLTYSAENFRGFADRVIKSNLQGDVRLEDHAVSLLSRVARDFDLIAIGSTGRGREIAARLAQRLNLPCITDAIAIHFNGYLEVERHSLSGRTIARERVRTPAVITVMPRTFEIVEGDETPEVVELSEKLEGYTRVLGLREKEKSGVELEEAEIVIGIGRGIGGENGIKKVLELKEILEAELGSTRPVAYDYGWLPEETMIGLSGRKTKPSLYIAIGVSGQIQHMMGVMRARRIVAINRDENAPIFDYADYGIVGDWKEVLPVLIETLKNLRR